jgi:hypothetical protein
MSHQLSHENVLFDVDFHFQCMSHVIMKVFSQNIPTTAYILSEKRPTLRSYAPENNYCH